MELNGGLTDFKLIYNRNDEEKWLNNGLNLRRVVLPVQ